MLRMKAQLSGTSQKYEYRNVTTFSTRWPGQRMNETLALG
jgi:hypothetical protein